MLYKRRFKPLVRRPRRKIAYRSRPMRQKLARTFNPQPTFVETYANGPATISIPNGTGIGLKFEVKIDDIPQVTQYANLYKQYRINWVKVMLLPRLTTDGVDPNTAIYNSLVANTQWMGSARMAYAIQDSPGVTVPAIEQEVLECNGSKIKLFKNKWSCSFKPVPDVAQINVVKSTPIFTRQKYRQWFNFDTTGLIGNPTHGSVIAYLTLPGNSPVGQEPFVQTYYVYYKVNFSLRDPQ